MGYDVVCKRCHCVIYKRGVAPSDISSVIYICGALCQYCADSLEDWWFKLDDVLLRGRA